MAQPAPHGDQLRGSLVDAASKGQVDVLAALLQQRAALSSNANGSTAARGDGQELAAALRAALTATEGAPGAMASHRRRCVELLLADGARLQPGDEPELMPRLWPVLHELAVLALVPDMVHQALDARTL